MLPEPNQSQTSSIWSTANESRDSFSHTPALQATLMVMVALALGTLWLMLQLPFLTVRLAVSLVPTVLLAYLVYRLYLTLYSVEFFADRVEIRMGAKVVALPYEKIRSIRFDSFSHDLLVSDGTSSFRIPRTIQGHRAILHRLHERVEVDRDHSPEMEIFVRPLPKAACIMSLVAMAALTIVTAAQMPQISVALLLLCLPTAYILLDQCILRSYRFTPDALQVRGIRGVSVYPRSELKDTWISKSGLSSRFQMTFKTGTVQFDEYLLSKALIQVSGYVERRWQHRVTPLSRRG